MPNHIPSLDIIDVASPCSMPWQKMAGGDQVRFCGECRLNVYNISGMEREAALKLVREHEGRICIHFFRRTDGTILTRDCPVGVSAVRRRLARMVAGAAAMVAFLSVGSAWAKISGRPVESKSESSGPLTKLAHWLEPPPPLQEFWGIAGNMVLPTLQPPTPLPILEEADPAFDSSLAPKTDS
jgi:hypothetical protein